MHSEPTILFSHTADNAGAVGYFVLYEQISPSNLGTFLYFNGENKAIRPNNVVGSKLNNLNLLFYSATQPIMQVLRASPSSMLRFRHPFLGTFLYFNGENKAIRPNNVVGSK